MSLADDLSTALRSAPDLNTSPGLAMAAAQTPDPTGNAQALAHSSNLQAVQGATGDVAQRHGGHSFLGSTMGFLSTGWRDARHVLGDVAGGALKVASLPLQEVQHQYRYAHDIIARHGLAAGVLELGVLAAGAVGAVALAPETGGASLLGEGALAAALGAVGTSTVATLGGEAALGTLARVNPMYSDSWAKTTDGAAYRDPHNGQMVSPGRDLAGILGLKEHKGLDAYSFVSGVTDGLFDLTTDPFVKVGEIRKAGQIANLTLKTAEDVDRVYQSSRGVQRAFGEMADMSAGEVPLRYPKFADMAERIGEANTPDEVAKTFKEAFAAGELTSDTAPTRSVLGSLGVRAKVATQEAQGPVTWAKAMLGHLPAEAPPDESFMANLARKLGNKVPTWIDETGTQQKGAFDVMSNDAVRVVHQTLRAAGASNRLAEDVATTFASTRSVAQRIQIYKNSVVEAVLSQLPEKAKALADDSEFIRNLRGAFDDAVPVGTEVGRAEQYGHDLSGQNLSRVLDGDGGTYAAGILASHTGLTAIPDYDAVRTLVRAKGNFNQIMGKTDDFFNSHFTSGIFKPLVLLQPGTGMRIGAGEAITGVARFGLSDYTKAIVQKAVTKMRGPESLDGTFGEAEASTLHDTMAKLAGGVEKVARISDDDAELMAKYLEFTGGNRVPMTLRAGHGVSEDLIGRQQQFLDSLRTSYQDVPKGWKVGEDFAEFGQTDPRHVWHWQAWLRGISQDEASQKAARSYIDELERHGVTTAGPLPAGEAAGEGLPALYHGTPRPITGELDTTGAFDRQARNLFGSGFYTTSSDEIAGSYVKKGAAAAGEGAKPTTYGVKWAGEGAPKVLDLESPIPDNVAGIFRRAVNTDSHYMNDVAVDDIAELNRMLDEHAPVSDVYRKFKAALADSGELHAHEADEIISDLNGEINSAGYDAMKYQGGKYAAKGEGTMHDAYIWLDQSKVKLAERVAEQTPRSSADATAAATAAAAKAAKEHWDAQPENILERYHRHFDTAVPGADPHTEWGQVIAENLKGATHTPDGVPHLDLLGDIAKGKITRRQLLEKIDTTARPQMVPGRELVADTGGSIEKIAAWGHRRFVEPIVNNFAREPLYYNEWKTQFKALTEGAVADGTMDEFEAMQYASQRAIAKMRPLIHNPMERALFSRSVQNWVPFYFAQEQAYRRVGRLLLEDPAAFRRSQLALTALHDVAHPLPGADGQGGQSSVMIPGTGFLGKYVPGAMNVLGFHTLGTVPVGFAGSLQSLQTVSPLVEDPAANFGPLAVFTGKTIAHLFPESTGFIDKIIGEEASAGSAWDTLIPNTTLRRVWQAQRMDSRPNQAAMMNIIQLEAFKQEQAEAKWIADGSVGPKPQIIPGPDASAMEKQQFLDRVKNHTRILDFVKAAIGFVSPMAPSYKFGDTQISDDLRKAITAKGGSLGQGITSFLEQHPDATPYTVFQSEAADGSPVQSTHPAQQWIKDNLALVEKYPAAAYYLVPQSKDKFDSAVYNEQLAMGLRRKRTPEEFLKQVYVAQGNEDFFSKDRPAYTQALLAAKGNKTKTAQIKANWSDYVQAKLTANPVWGDDYMSPDRQNAQKVALSQLQSMFDNNEAPAGPQTAAVRELFDDYNTYQASSLPGRRDPVAVAHRKTLDIKWERYLDNLVTEKPELSAIVNRLFRTMTEADRLMSGLGQKAS